MVEVEMAGASLDGTTLNNGFSKIERRCLSVTWAEEFELTGLSPVD